MEGHIFLNQILLKSTVQYMEDHIFLNQILLKSSVYGRSYFSESPKLKFY